MTENKRFTMDECGNITDTVTNRTLYVENIYTACNYYVNLLNSLDEENTQLKKILNISKNDNVNDIVDVLNLQQTTIWELNRENEQLKNNLSEIEKIINNRLDPKVVPKFPDGKTELFVEEKWGYGYALEQLKKKLIRTDLLFQNEKED
jgi:hypothetical protein